MSHPVLHLTAKNFKKPHIAKEMQPSSVQEHGGKEGQVIDEGKTVTVPFRIFNRNNPEVIGEILKEFYWQGSFKQEDNPAQDYQNPCG
jgi:hypothetical protein